MHLHRLIVVRQQVAGEERDKIQAVNFRQDGPCASCDQDFVSRKPFVADRTRERVKKLDVALLDADLPAHEALIFLLPIAVNDLVLLSDNLPEVQLGFGGTQPRIPGMVGIVNQFRGFD